MHTTAMIRHGNKVVNDVVQHQNQTPDIAKDHLLLPRAKQIQRNTPETHGENKYVVMYWGLHIEMETMKL